MSFQEYGIQEFVNEIFVFLDWLTPTQDLAFTQHLPLFPLRALYITNKLL